MNNERRWQHKVVEIKPRFLGSVKAADMHSRLDSLGSRGCELASVCQQNRYQAGYLYLKRPS